MSTQTPNKSDGSGSAFADAGNASEDTGSSFADSRNRFSRSSVPATREPIPATDEHVPAAHEPIPGSSERVPAASEPTPAASERVPATAERAIRLRKRARNAKPGLKVPIAELLREAAMAAAFVTRYANEFRAFDADLAANAPARLLEAIRQAQAAQTEVDATPPRPSTAAIRLEARRCVRRMARVCAFWAETNGTGDDVRVVKQLREHTKSQSLEGLSLALQDWTHLVRAWRERVEALPGYDEKSLEHAQALAAELLETTLKKTENDARVARNHALNTIVELLGRARRTAKVAFEDTPKIVSEIASAWERTRRSSASRVRQPTSHRP